MLERQRQEAAEHVITFDCLQCGATAHFTPLRDLVPCGWCGKLRYFLNWCEACYLMACTDCCRSRPPGPTPSSDEEDEEENAVEDDDNNEDDDGEDGNIQILDVVVTCTYAVVVCFGQ